MEEHSFQVRAGDKNDVVLCAHDQYPSDKTLTQEQKEVAHGGYIAFGTDSRDGLVQLMDDGAIGPYAKIICVYTSVSVSDEKWMHHDGCVHSAYPGKAFIFVERRRTEGLLSRIHGILNDCGAYNENVIGPGAPARTVSSVTKSQPTRRRKKRLKSKHTIGPTRK